jgi:hypothetical protein
VKPKSQYLGEQYIAFYPRLAALLGSADRALILVKMSDLIDFFETVGDPDRDHWIQRVDGKVWYRASHDMLHQKYFPWMTAPTLKKNIYWLRDAGYLLLRGGWREERLFRREVWFAIDYEFLEIALSAIENENIRAKDRIDPTEGSNRSDRRIESIRPKDRIDPIYHKPLESLESLDSHSMTPSSSSPRKPSNSNGVPDGNEESDDALHILALHNNGWVTAIDVYGQTQLVQLSVERLAEEYQQVVAALEEMFVKTPVAENLAGKCTLYQVECWKVYLSGRSNVRRKSGFLVTVLSQEQYPPKTHEEELRQSSREHYTRLAEDPEYQYQYARKWKLDGLSDRYDAEEDARLGKGDAQSSPDIAK